MREVFITDITGQDGSYLSEFLLEKNYEVRSIKRRALLFNTQQVDPIYQDPHKPNPKVRPLHRDLTDISNLACIRPNTVYNLSAQPHVAVSFNFPRYIANVDAFGAPPCSSDWSTLQT